MQILSNYSWLGWYTYFYFLSSHDNFRFLSFVRWAWIRNTHRISLFILAPIYPKVNHNFHRSCVKGFLSCILKMFVLIIRGCTQLQRYENPNQWLFWEKSTYSSKLQKLYERRIQYRKRSFPAVNWFWNHPVDRKWKIHVRQVFDNFWKFECLSWWIPQDVSIDVQKKGQKEAYLMHYKNR